jgi:hypothetical protein
MWNNMKETITAAGEETMGTTIQKKNVEWFEEECREKIAKKNEARSRMLQKHGVAMRNIRNCRRMLRSSAKRKRKNISRSNLRKLSS